MALRVVILKLQQIQQKVQVFVSHSKKIHSAGWEMRQCDMVGVELYIIGTISVNKFVDWVLWR